MADWNDLRHFLAVARFGSTLAAARALKVSQATVSRRVTLLEEALGIALFARQPSGYVLTARGAALVPLAETVEEAVERFGDAVAAESRRLSGQVRLTTVESAANAWVIPAIARLHQANPEIEVEIVTTDKNLDLARGEADVAIRFGARPSEDVLVVRQIAELEECIYASRELVTRLGRPVDLAGIAAYPLVAEIESDGWQSRWIAEHVPEARIVHRVSSLSGIIASIRAGIGAAALPCIMGDELKGLVRLLPPIEALTMPCWLVTTDPARRQPHIRALIDVVVAQVSRSLLRARGDPSEALTA